MRLDLIRSREAAGIRDKRKKLLDGSKMDRVAGIHVFDASLELAIAWIGILAQLNYEVSLHNDFRIGGAPAPVVRKR